MTRPLTPAGATATAAEPGHEFEGATLTLGQLCALALERHHNVVTVAQMRSRLFHRWDPARALREPVRRHSTQRAITADELDRLLRWRSSGLGPELDAQKITDSLTVEGLPYAEIPDDLYDIVVEFRHLRHDARLAKVRRWLDDPRRVRAPRRGSAALTPAGAAAMAAATSADAAALRAALEAAGGHVGKAALALGCNRRTLDRRITALGLRAWLRDAYSRAAVMRAVKAAPPVVAEVIGPYQDRHRTRWAVLLSCGHTASTAKDQPDRPELGAPLPCPSCACPGCRPRLRALLDLAAPLGRWEACPDCGTRHPPYLPPVPAAPAGAGAAKPRGRPRKIDAAPENTPRL